LIVDGIVSPTLGEDHLVEPFTVGRLGQIAAAQGLEA
jgi:hypothetical protein